jgi:hypothetical protein
MRATKIILAFMVVWVGILWADIASAATFAQSFMPGVACTAANLNQALQLSWDHFRIYNPSASDYFVVCPVNTSAIGAADSDDDNVVSFVDGYVDVWFKTGNEPDVTCIWRQMPYDAATTDAQIFMVGTAHSSGGVANVADILFEIYGLGWMTSPDYHYQTVTCALPPGTGINNIEFEATN